MNQTKETAELISFGDAAALKQMPGLYVPLYIYC